MDREIRRGLYAKLTADATLTGLLATTTSIYDGVAPQGAAFPYVILDLQDAGDEYAFTDRAFEAHSWMVRAVDEATTGDTADLIAARADTVLTDGVLSVTGRTPLNIRRERQVRYWENRDGNRYIHSAGIYRLYIE